MIELAGHAVVMPTGHFVGIWRELEIAEKIANRSQGSKDERIEPLYRIVGAAPGPILEVVAERQRQREEEGWDDAHDDAHEDESLAAAAACYALPRDRTELEERTWRMPYSRYSDDVVLVPMQTRVPVLWPHSWSAQYWKPKDRRRDLVRAAALILAELERLDRQEPGA